MKIWKSFSAEHSAKLKIVGTFKTTDDASHAAQIFNRLLRIQGQSKSTHESFSEEMMKAFSELNFASFNHDDPEQLDYFYELTPVGNQIIVDTDELEIQALMKVFIHCGAKVELYSKHDYPQGS